MFSTTRGFTAESNPTHGLGLFGLCNVLDIYEVFKNRRISYKMHNFGSSEITDVGKCSVSGATQLAPYTRHHYNGSPSSFLPQSDRGSFSLLFDEPLHL